MSFVGAMPRRRGKGRGRGSIGRGIGRDEGGRGKDSPIAERSDVHFQEKNIVTSSPSQARRGRDSPTRDT